MGIFFFFHFVKFSLIEYNRFTLKGIVSYHVHLEDVLEDFPFMFLTTGYPRRHFIKINGTIALSDQTIKWAIFSPFNQAGCHSLIRRVSIHIVKM